MTKTNCTSHNNAVFPQPQVTPPALKQIILWLQHPILKLAQYGRQYVYLLMCEIELITFRPTEQ